MKQNREFSKRILTTSTIEYRNTDIYNIRLHINGIPVKERKVKSLSIDELYRHMRI